MMDELAVSNGVAKPIADPTVRTRIDPRSGKVLTVRDASFWQEQEARRLREGLTIKAYSNVHGLALSTLRRWSAVLAGRGNQRRRSSEPSADSVGTTANRGVAFLPIPIHRSAHAAPVDAGVEVALGTDLRVTLSGAAAQCVLDAVLARLQAPR